MIQELRREDQLTDTTQPVEYITKNIWGGKWRAVVHQLYQLTELPPLNNLTLSNNARPNCMGVYPFIRVCIFQSVTLTERFQFAEISWFVYLVQRFIWFVRKPYFHQADRSPISVFSLWTPEYLFFQGSSTLCLLVLLTNQLSLVISYITKAPFPEAFYVCGL